MAGMGNWTLDPVTMEVQASDQLLRLYGLPPGSKPLQADFAAMHPDDRESSREQINLCLRTGKPYDMEYRVVMEDGSVRWLNGIGRAERDADGRIVRLVGATQDITGRKLAEERIRAALNEKETLLRELYHRTKNNMQVIASLLDLQAGKVADERLTAAFTATKSRIYSMALVHQKLYEAKDLSRVNLREYIDDLVRLLMRTYRMSSAPLTYVQEMEDVFVLVDSAIPCGLIVNELISNALKHAFPSGKSGELRVRLWRTGEGEVCLEVADNGVGLPPGFDFRRDGRLGLQNILALGEDQLEGTVELETSAGVALRLRFKDDLYHPRV
jgi:two-component sensor histidine kinase